MKYVVCLVLFLLYIICILIYDVFLFIFFLCFKVYIEDLVYVRYFGSEGLKMSNTCFLWLVFVKLGWGIRWLERYYEILCVDLLLRDL